MSKSAPPVGAGPRPNARGCRSTEADTHSKTLEVSPPLKAIHALGQAPVIRDGDTILAESARSSLTSSTATEEAGLPRNPKPRPTRTTLLATLRERQPHSS
jgi:hypothetical protein